MNQDKIRKILERLQAETPQELEYIGEVNIANLMLQMKEKDYKDQFLRNKSGEFADTLRYYFYVNAANGQRVITKNFWYPNYN